MTLPNETITKALEHHQNGELNKAGDLYQEVLQEDPVHCDALHLMGLVLQQKKDPEQAVEYIQKAIHHNEGASIYHSNLGNVYRELNQIDNAMNSFREAIQIEPGFAGAHYNLAMSFEAISDTDNAISSYEDAIKCDPGFVEAVNNLGKLYNSLEIYDRAIRCFEHAISLNSESAYLHFNYANALKGSGQLEEATKSYHIANELDPNSSIILNNLGTIYKDQNNYSEAEAYLIKATECVEVDSEVYNNLGSLYMDQNNPEAGIEQFQKAVDRSPENDEFHLNLEKSLKNFNCKKEASQEIQPTTNQINKELTEIPGIIEAHFQLGKRLIEERSFKEAYHEFDQILKQDPDHLEAGFKIGFIQTQLNNHESAIEHLEHCVELGHKDDVIYNMLGTSYLIIKKENIAKDYFKKAIAENPENKVAHQNLACLYIIKSDFNNALVYIQESLRIDPNYEAALSNEGVILKELGQHQEAKNSFNRTLELYPDNSNALLQNTILELLEGNWEAGWNNFHHRWDLITDSRNFNKPEWDGEDLSDKTIFIHAEQGIGDEIMYASCISEILNIADRCFIECDPRLVNLFSRIFPEAGIVIRHVCLDDKANDFWKEVDYILPIGSIPKHFRKNEESFPKDESYLIPDPELCSYWRNKLDSFSNKIKVGISWNASKQSKRSIPLNDWTPILSRDDITVINLQYGEIKDELDSLSPEVVDKIHCFDEIDPLKELDHFSALIHELDLVISVDNSTVHFAGALGTQTFALLPTAASYRWMSDRSDTVWYSSVELLRQKDFAPWSDIFLELHEKVNQVTGTTQNYKTTKNTIGTEKDRTMVTENITSPEAFSDSVTSDIKEIPSDVAREKAKYEKMWKVDQYRRFSPGLEDSKKINFLKQFKELSVKTILDAGCGSGKLMQKVVVEHADDFTIHGFDISENCLDPFFDSMKEEILTTGCLWNSDDMNKTYDAVVCTDVLEHIPTHKIPDVLSCLKNSMNTIGFLSIALFDDCFGPQTLGEPLHLTVKKPNWWFAKIMLAGMQVAAEHVERSKDGKDLWLHLFVTPVKPAKN